MRKGRITAWRLFAAFVLGTMLLGVVAPKVHAEGNGDGKLYEKEETKTVAVYNREGLLKLAENCRLDSYSLNLKVVLKGDIDLSGAEFEGIPVFAGEFDGNGYRITGLKIDGEGSVKGLFRYLQETAVVRNLVVEGDVTPSGTRSDVGGIAGSNAGLIQDCEFHGAVSGADNVGGIAGINEMSGIIERCRTQGVVSGNHFTGGIVGNNFGVVRRGENSASVNITVEQSSVGLSDITIESMAGSESVATVTDIGGIAGSSTGVLRKCINRAQVGYRQMGYNVGGIAGSQVGYVVDCINYGEVYGRKEVGGIVGHQEPSVTLVYEMDTFQTLEEQLNTMETLTNRATANAQFGSYKLNNQMNTMNGHVQSARDSIEKINQMVQNNEVDSDSMVAHQNNLSESLKGMTSTMQEITNTSKATSNALSRDVRDINNQMDAINNTLDSAEEGLGGDVTDVSDADTEELMSGEIFNCSNFGMIEGDLNVGGITGAIALETDLDSEEDVDILGEVSANFVSEMRSVVLDSKNWGQVSVKKQCGGGIVGRQDLGLVKGCTNLGTIGGDDAEYVGGIVGQSMSYIRNCNIKCVLKGKKNVGGVAGSGTIASDCRSMTEILGAVEMYGAIFGLGKEDIKKEETPVIGNYYLPIGADIGAIDGISYAGYAEPMLREQFLQLENLSDVFKVVTVQFLSDATTVKNVTLKVGEELLMEQIPAVPDKTGMVGFWNGLDDTDLSDIFFDMCFEAVYTSNLATLQSKETGENGKPILLVLGEFAPEQEIAVAALEEIPVRKPGQKLLAAWKYALDGEGVISEVRFLKPTAFEEGTTQLWICDSLGVWRRESFSIDGSYLVFSANADDEAFALLGESTETVYELWLLVGGGFVFICVSAFVVMGRIKKRKRKENNL